MSTMTWPDVLIVVVFLVSIGVAIFRGFAREFISIVTWVAAIWLGIVFSDEAAQWLPHSLDGAQFSLGDTQIDIKNLRVGVAFIGIAVVVLITGAILNYLFGIVMKAHILKGVDRFLGAVFGAVRATVIIVALIMTAYLTNLPTSTSWRTASFLPPFEGVAVWVVQNLPAKYARYFEPHGA